MVGICGRTGRVDDGQSLVDGWAGARKPVVVLRCIFGDHSFLDKSCAASMGDVFWVGLGVVWMDSSVSGRTMVGAARIETIAVYVC